MNRIIGRHTVRYYHSFSKLSEIVRRLVGFGYSRIENSNTYCFCGEKFCYLVELVYNS